MSAPPHRAVLVPEEHVEDVEAFLYLLTEWDDTDETDERPNR